MQLAAASTIFPAKVWPSFSLQPPARPPSLRSGGQDEGRRGQFFDTLVGVALFLCSCYNNTKSRQCIDKSMAMGERGHYSSHCVLQMGSHSIVLTGPHGCFISNNAATR